MQILKQHKQVRNFVLACILILFGGLMLLQPMKVKADDDVAHTLYNVVTALGEYMGKQLEPDEDGTVAGIELLAGAAAGNAGGALAYSNTSWLSSIISTSSSSYDYSSLINLPVGSGTSNELLYYCQYGRLLAELGLDTTAYGSNNNIYTIILGGLMIFAYVLCLGVSTFFKAIIWILQALNPFALFAKGFNELNLINLTWIGTDSSDTVLFGLSGILSKWYKAFYNLSWAIVIPISFLFLVVSLLLFRQTNNAPSKIKRYAVRIVFVCLGIPLCGAFYTMCLDKMEGVLDGGNTIATKVVASTFVDFESWCENGRLAPVESGTFILSQSSSGVDDSGNLQIMTDKAGGIVDGLSYFNVRNTAYEINSKFHYKGLVASGYCPFPGANSTSDGNVDMSDWNTDMSSTASLNGSLTISKTFDMLFRYFTGQFYYASDYETLVKGNLSAVSDTAKGVAINKMFNKSIVAEDYGTDYTDRFTNLTAFEGQTNVNIFANGALTYDELTGVFTNGGKDVLNKANSRDNFAAKKTGLSSVAMYNYLNTAFNDNGSTLYSPQSATSDLIRKSHRSVSLVGTGLSRAMYYLDCLILLGTVSVIGYFYGFSMIFSNIKRSIHVITTVPTAMLGFIKSIAKIITYTIVMILEIIGTIFLYTVVTELLLNLSQIIEYPFSILLSKTSMANVNMASTFIVLLLLVDIIAYIWFCCTAMKLRKGVIKGLDDAAEDIVNKFLEVSTTPAQPKTPGLVQQAVGAVASGAGMAVGNKLMNGGAGLTKGAQVGDAVKSTINGGNGKDGANGKDSGGNNPTGGGDGVSNDSQMIDGVTQNVIEMRPEIDVDDNANKDKLITEQLNSNDSLNDKKTQAALNATKAAVKFGTGDKVGAVKDASKVVQSLSEVPSDNCNKSVSPVNSEPIVPSDDDDTINTDNPNTTPVTQPTQTTDTITNNTSSGTNVLKSEPTEQLPSTSDSGMRKTGATPVYTAKQQKNIVKATKSTLQAANALKKGDVKTAKEYIQQAHDNVDDVKRNMVKGKNSSQGHQLEQISKQLNNASQSIVSGKFDNALNYCVDANNNLQTEYHNEIIKKLNKKDDDDGGNHI